MYDEMFQKVFDLLQDVIPSAWEKVVFYAGYTEGSYSMKYYFCEENKQFVDCFSQKGVSKSQLIKLFMNIDKILRSERNKLEEKKRWNVFTMVVDIDGHMKTDFDMTDISEHTVEYEQNWKEKYISKTN